MIRNVVNMRAVIQILIFTGLICFTHLVSGQSTMPDVDVKSLDGQALNINDVIEEGQITVISFWATWCHPCKKELDAIAEIFPEWEEAYDVKLIAVSVDDARALAKVGPLVAEKDWPYTVVTDQNQHLMRAMQFQSVPHTLLLNQQGEIVYTHSGYLPGDEETLEEEISALVQ